MMINLNDYKGVLKMSLMDYVVDEFEREDLQSQGITVYSLN